MNQPYKHTIFTFICLAFFASSLPVNANSDLPPPVSGHNSAQGMFSNLPGDAKIRQVDIQTKIYHTDKKLDKLLKTQQGQKIYFSELSSLMNKVRSYYEAAGYNVKVELPIHEISDGLVRIYVVDKNEPEDEAPSLEMSENTLTDSSETLDGGVLALSTITMPEETIAAEIDVDTTAELTVPEKPLDKDIIDSQPAIEQNNEAVPIKAEAENNNLIRIEIVDRIFLLQDRPLSKKETLRILRWEAE